MVNTKHGFISVKLFDQFDTDKSGDLSKEEIKKAMFCLGLKAWDLDNLFDTMDTNADGKVSLEEFKAHLNSPSNKFIFQAMCQKLNNEGLIAGF